MTMLLGNAKFRLLGNAKFRFQNELSSRPERSVVERSALAFLRFQRKHFRPIHFAPRYKAKACCRVCLRVAQLLLSELIQARAAAALRATSTNPLSRAARSSEATC